MAGKVEKTLLSDIESQINDETIEASDIKVIKRNGSIEPYDVEKMRRVCLWACDGVEAYCEMLLSSTRIKLYDKIKIAHVYDELIKSAANKISRMHPQFEKIAAKLLLLKIYKDGWNIKKTRYPNYLEVVELGIKKKKYNQAIFGAYSEEELAELGNYIQQERDFLFTYKSLYIFNEKYCLNSTKTIKLELPQHAYMRIALSLFRDEPKQIRLQLVKDMYDILSQHLVTVATPIMLNAGTINQQLSSCVLSQVGDNTHSIMDTAKQVATYSKYKGGNAVDFSNIRSSGSFIVGNDGFSSGPVPFIKIFESTVKAFNQGSTRPGACAIYFPWWHYNFKEMIVLKSNTGTEENRARQLKYSVKINDLLIKRTLRDEDVTLFDPKDVPDLLNTFGEEFEKKYIEYEQKAGIRKQVLPAKDVVALIFKERAETGNIYLFHEENVNKATLLNRYVNSSNLCCEIVLPSRYSSLNKEIVYHQDSKTDLIISETKAGEIALCNLSSINVYEYMKLNEEEKEKVVNTLVRALDNTIDVATYPVKEAEITNKNYRYLGIGVLNMANYLADKKIVIDSQEALEETHKIFDKLSFRIIDASNKLAQVKGSFPRFAETEWAAGIVPIMKANKKALALTKYQPNMKKWEELGERIKNTGLRNAQLLAIAPTATSGKAVNATESIEPIQNLFYKEDGKINLPTLVPNIQNWKYYKVAQDCDQYMLIKAAAIRQMYLDQAQSINVYFKKITSLKEFSLFHFWAFELGIKTFYYCKTLKEELEEICESCS